MKKIFLILCLGIIGFSRISLAAKEKGEEIANIKKNAEKIESETSSDKAEAAVEEKKKIKISNPFKKKKVEWELVWRDEFDENKLDDSKWSYWENGNPWNSGNYLDENGNLVDQYGFKAKQYYLRDNVRLENGYLVITVKKEDDKTVKIDGKDRKILYSSGAIHTKDKFTIHEGKIEMRAIMPEGVGTWPAFWTWPADYSHASFIGSDLRIKRNEDLTRFNTYAVEWDDKEIKWLFNGRVYKRLSMKKVARSSENTFKLPHFLMINVALENKTGEDGNIKFPTEMKVDYVRVYKKK